MVEIKLKNQNATTAFARQLAKNLSPGSIVTLSGDLGAGKTFMCQEIIRTICGVNTIVSSPTFNILQKYQVDSFVIYHFDLYRLKDSNEIYELGIEDAWQQNICLVEWPELIEDIIPRPYISIKITMNVNLERLCSIVTLV
ncbi:tRNA threonylcarbamoyl adenosine modification protein YjeE [Orientia chuto str. Dubai]|uniref:tRNA threonylcarbamoyladenosine biosynthesis protein TsaE n=1 Tax=Orientia chuto str. Dubai TaxID=1359168 RepID=A0A0F3MJV1_9RICK|nr:tRNA (adenosine(37)-N6)-threonylcarbamoyltransferase complex ATPase subunit type 1 TsaE [Candidatus Orientia mediorientalis]KJV55931.1 tRNA threonylcarbamoyl adenosine modification protein YjeE [Orientia chuto str. Dubai]